jgi:hypothetical protein
MPTKSLARICWVWREMASFDAIERSHSLVGSLGMAVPRREMTMTIDHLDDAFVTRAGRSPRRAIRRGFVVAVLAAVLVTCAPDAFAEPQCVGRCAGKNWCEDRTDLCAHGGKCFVRRFGGNICGEILFQANTCADCEPPNCLDCVCILGAGGGDKCNNGAHGSDYVCIRAVRR